MEDRASCMHFERMIWRLLGKACCCSSVEVCSGGGGGLWTEMKERRERWRGERLLCPSCSVVHAFLELRCLLSIVIDVSEEGATSQTFNPSGPTFSLSKEFATRDLFTESLLKSNSQSEWNGKFLPSFAQINLQGQLPEKGSQGGIYKIHHTTAASLTYIFGSILGSTKLNTYRLSRQSFNRCFYSAATTCRSGINVYAVFCRSFLTLNCPSGCIFTCSAWISVPKS